MIKNERQYRVTRSQVDRFVTALEGLRSRSTSGDELRDRLEVAAVQSQLEELRAEMEEYDSLRHGRAEVGRLESLDDLPRLLIRARISQGLTQRDLGERLGMQEQQVQRYEANDWATASLPRLIEVADALGVSIAETFPSGPEAVDAKQLARQLRRAGLEPNFVARRLAPTGDDGEDLAAVLDLAARVNRIYGWSPSNVLAGENLEVDLPVAVGFKWPRRASEPRVRAYTMYTHYLALLALQGTSAIDTPPIPASAKDFRTAVVRRSGAVTFETVLDFVWRLGIPVVPLADPGAFHAVLWRTGGRNVIVLKQQNRTLSRWVFDLLHEVGHAIEEPTEAEYGVVDDDPEADADGEVAANRFAGDVLLDGRAEELAQECVEAARGKVEYLKVAVRRVAARSGVETADLANYLAYRLSLQNINWWGTATNLQSGEGDPWVVAREQFFRCSDLRALNVLDRGLLSQALAG
ncbi:MAG TPA: XRE family transcriptional regulator [Acidimicrobiales bacterium]|nr:XRE family transcriptional regulator [Acidimicrobiales bacterium]